MGRKTPKNKTAAIRGLERRRHFENGGSLSEWRGVSSAHKNRKDKRKNRRTRDEEAIKESKEE